MNDSIENIARRYRVFADREASGVSPVYERYARSAAENMDLLVRLLTLPEGKQQPNLLFAATRHAIGLPPGGSDFARHVLASWDAVEPIMLFRSTQTNEPGRCACLLPAFGLCDEPLAILEVGASAGLCLFPDSYGYDYGHTVLDAPEADAPRFPCRAPNPTPIPALHPDIVWRAGLDLNPLDVRSQGDMNWLRTLVWPEHRDRLLRLDAAISVAQRTPPKLVAGDLLKDTEALAAQAPTDARLVIFHTAVLSYVPPEVRRDFAELVHDIGADWVANEGVRVLPDVIPSAVRESRPGAFVLSRNGKALARTGPHGQFVEWL